MINWEDRVEKFHKDSSELRKAFWLDQIEKGKEKIKVMEEHWEKERKRRKGWFLNPFK